MVEALAVLPFDPVLAEADPLGDEQAGAAVLALFALFSVILFVLWKGHTALFHSNFFKQDMSSAGPLDPLSVGGITHAIVGTLIMTFISLLITVPLGVACAVFLNETGGKMAGTGILSFPNGMRYEGAFKDGNFHGRGRLTYANGDVYSGKFQNDRISGFGTMVYKTGDKYVGEWKNEKPNGKGNYYYSTGERYEGEMADGRFEGKGKFLYNDGSSYEGDWKND